MKRRIIGVLAVGVAATVAAVTAVAAYAAPIVSEGPLTRVEVSTELNCAVQYAGDTDPSFYGDTACATLLAVGGTLYGPTSIPAGSSAAPRTAWTPVSQTNSGTGTSADPYTVVTVVTGGPVSLTQTDTYVVGENSYRTSMQVTNTSNEPIDTVLFHAADCYLQDSDFGFGEFDAATGAITCRAPDAEGQNTPTTRIEQFVPLAASSDHLYASYSQVWAAVGTQQPFPNEVRNGDTQIDNGIGLSWSLSIPAGQSASAALLTNFSPIGLVSLPTQLSVSPAAVATGETSTVTARVDNPNTLDQTLDSLTVTLPAGVAYVAGSSTLSEPTVSGSTLTFAGPIVVGASGALNFTFGVDAAATPGGNITLAGVTASGAPVIGSQTALTVSEGSTPEPTPTPTPTETATPTPSPSPSATSTPAPNGDLATTGSDLTPTWIGLGVAGALIVVGGAIVIGVRARRQH